MKTFFKNADSIYTVTYELKREHNEMPVWKSWTNEAEIIENSSFFFDKISLSLNNEEIDFECFHLKNNLLSLMFHDSMEFLIKESEFISYHKTGTIPSSAYSYMDDRFSNYDIGSYSRLISIFICKHGESFELRQSGEKLKYVKKDENNDIMRDSNGMALYMDENEMIEKGLPLYDTFIAIFNSQQQCVGIASDEWGADGVWVHSSYQKRGIGLFLLTEFRKQFPESRKMGQMTSNGILLARAYFKLLNNEN